MKPKRKFNRWRLSLPNPEVYNEGAGVPRRAVVSEHLRTRVVRVFFSKIGDFRQFYVSRLLPNFHLKKNFDGNVSVYCIFVYRELEI